MLVTLYSWRRKDPRTGRWRKLTWRMTEASAAEHAKVYGVELEKVAGSEEVREDLRGTGATFFHAHCSAAIEAHFDKVQARLGSLPAKGEETE